MLLTSINLTKSVIELFRAGLLSHLPGSLLSVLCDVHHAMLTVFYDKWFRDRRSVGDFQKTLKEIESICRKSIKNLLKMSEKVIDDVEHATANYVENLKFIDLDQQKHNAANQGQKISKADQRKLKNYAV